MPAPIRLDCKSVEWGTPEPILERVRAFFADCGYSMGS